MVSSSSPSSTGAWPSVRTAARGIIGTWSSSVQLRMCHERGASAAGAAWGMERTDEGAKFKRGRAGGEGQGWG